MRGEGLDVVLILYIPLRSYKTREAAKIWKGDFDFISHYVHIKPAHAGRRGEPRHGFISHYVHIKLWYATCWMTLNDLYIPLRSYKTHSEVPSWPDARCFISHYVHIKRWCSNLLFTLSALYIPLRSYKTCCRRSSTICCVINFISHYVHIKLDRYLCLDPLSHSLYPTTFI